MSQSKTLWHGRYESQAAESLRLTASDLRRLGVVDQIVPEPPAGAHTDADETARLLEAKLRDSLAAALKLSPLERKARRYGKLRALGG